MTRIKLPSGQMYDSDPDELTEAMTVLRQAGVPEERLQETALALIVADNDPGYAASVFRPGVQSGWLPSAAGQVFAAMQQARTQAQGPLQQQGQAAQQGR